MNLAHRIASDLNLSPDPSFLRPLRERIFKVPFLTDGPPPERSELIRRQPAYGNIICRCEMISEGEIIDAIRRTPGARSLDGVKRRTRAGMGRCQSGFCSPRVMEILARELGLDISDITKSGPRSLIIEGSNKHI